MKIHRIDHIGVNVNDLDAAKEFFLDLGLEAQGEGEMEGELLDRVVGLDHAKTRMVMMGPPGGQATIELIKYYSPADEAGIQPNHPNKLGISHICFAVEDLEATVAKLKKKGVEFFSEIQNYEDTYKLVYCHGPEGIILELAQELK